MINKKLIKALLNSATQERKTIIIEELLNHISMNYDYNDQKAGHILEMLVDNSSVVRMDDVNLDYIKNNPKLLMYEYEKYNITDIKVSDIDNIDCIVIMSFKYLEKINEDRADITYTETTTHISYIDFPQILKNVK